MLVRVPVFYWYGDTDAEQARRLAICLRAAFEELLEDARMVVWTDTDQVTYEGDMQEWDFHAVYDEALDQALLWWEEWEREVQETGESVLEGDPYLERYRRAQAAREEARRRRLAALREAQESGYLGKHIVIPKE